MFYFFNEQSLFKSTSSKFRENNHCKITMAKSFTCLETGF